jgi:hypothetical protein
VLLAVLGMSGLSPTPILAFFRSIARARPLQEMQQTPSVYPFGFTMNLFMARWSSLWPPASGAVGGRLLTVVWRAARPGPKALSRLVFFRALQACLPVASGVAGGDLRH